MLRAASLLSLMLACAAPAPSAGASRPPASPPRGAPDQDREARIRELQAQVVELTRQGEYEAVLDVIAQLQEFEIEHLINAARRSLREGDPAAALATVEQALLEAPHGPSARLVHGDASLELGRDPYDALRLEAAITSYLMASESPPRWLERDAQREFRARALLGASQAGTALRDREQALRDAGRCLKIVESLGTGAGVRNRLGEWPEKRFFEAAFDVYAAVRHSDPERAEHLAREMEAALRRPLARNSEEAWPWTSLAALYLEEGRFGEARETAFDGLAHHPNDTTLPGQLVDAARGIGGADAVYAELALLKERAPLAALPWWYSARERFDAALARLGKAPVGAFVGAEADFRRCRELQPEYGRECLSYEALCRGAVGWTHLAAGRLEEARSAFRSMEEPFEGGLRSELRGALRSGLDGLDQVGRGFFERDQLGEAAGVYLFLHGYEPGSADWAVRAGQFHRDAGARLQVQAEAAQRLSSNPDRDPERAEELLQAAGIPVPAAGDASAWQATLARADVQLRERASRMFETSYAAYRAAAELEPENVRVLTDATELPIHHLGRDLDWAEQTLERCVELGRGQLAGGGLDEEARLALTQAWGDAHQNLGVLWFDHKHDLEVARRWFEQSLAIGPYPRPIVEEDYLPRCTASGSAKAPR